MELLVYSALFVTHTQRHSQGILNLSTELLLRIHLNSHSDTLKQNSAFHLRKRSIIKLKQKQVEKPIAHVYDNKNLNKVNKKKLKFYPSANKQKNIHIYTKKNTLHSKTNLNKKKNARRT